MLYAIELMRRDTDQKPVGLLPPKATFSPEIPEEFLSKEAARPLTPPSRNRWRYSKRTVYKRRRRVACLVLVVVLAMGSLLLLNDVGLTSEELLDRVVAPAGERAPQPLTKDPAIEEEEATGEEAAAAPDDPTLYLTVPRLGLYEHTVRNDESEAALDLGAIKLPRTGFPWEKEDSNTYIACHRLGWPGNESFNQCLNLPSMQKGDTIFLEDTNGTAYEYRVTETLVVEPNDTWVTAPVPDKNVVSLQTCIESPGDLSTLGPNWSARFVVRAEQAEEGPSSNFRRLAGKSVASYTDLLQTPSARYQLDSVPQAASNAGRYAGILFARMSRVQVAVRRL